MGCLVGVHVTHFGVAWAEEEHPDIWTNENAMLIGVILKIGTAKALARWAPDEVSWVHIDHVNVVHDNGMVIHEALTGNPVFPLGETL